MIERPSSSEYAPYFATYIGLVPSGDILEILGRQIEASMALFSSIGEEKSGHRYQPGKWSVKQIVGHLADTERIFTYRALCFARGEKAPLAGFEQDDYVAGGDFDSRDFSSICSEYRRVRDASLAFYEGLEPEALTRGGTASGNPWTVRALAYVTAGHELHHRGVIQSRYL